MMRHIRDISLASFNLYNLQLAGTQTYDNAPPFTDATYAARLDWAGSILRRLDADVIAFQELWSAQCLRDLFKAAGLDEHYTLHFIGDKWYDIAVAAAVRKPWQVKEQTVHKDFPPEFRLLKRKHGTPGAQAARTDDDIDVGISMFSRSVLELQLIHEAAADLPPLHVLCAHLKSKLATRLDAEEAASGALKPHQEALGAALSTIRRTAEAAALRMLLTNLTRGNADRAVALLGDLNDGAHSNTLAILSAQPRFRRIHKSRIGESSDSGLYPVTFLQALSDFRDVAYSHIHDGVREQLDHVLVSEQFYDYSTHRYWSFREQLLLNDHLDDPAGSGSACPTSDHGVVCARFQWDPA